MLTLTNEDCMELMARYPDGYFQLSIVDPPYGIGESMKKRENTTSDKWKNPYKKQHNPKNWDGKTPEIGYFSELQRVSKNQIIWGSNHFIQTMAAAGYWINSSCWIVWDKKNGDSDFSDCELAWTTFKSGVRKFEWLWNGFQKQQPETRIHPTQKPVALYKWLLHNYAKEGDKILDTHLGSMSIAIACHDYGFDLTGCELDKDYYEAGMKRVNAHVAQQKIF